MKNYALNKNKLFLSFFLIASITHYMYANSMKFEALFLKLLQFLDIQGLF